MFGLFVIEAGQEPVAVLNYDGKPIVVETGAEAAQIARHCATGDCFLNNYATVKCQPRRLADDAWKARELGRFADGTYVPLPWSDLPKLTLTADHYPHVSTVDGAKIAYTQDAAKGAGDIQTRVKPGKYLQQFYGDIFDAPTIARMSAEFSKQFGESNELLFADTADEFERIYRDGPHSCMAYDANHFDSSIHPVRIYAAGDLAIAYLVRDQRITARALVWPAKHIYGRVYGDECRLVDLLESVAYVPGSLRGARMLRIEEENGFVCPYIDGYQSAGDDGEHLILGGDGVCGGNQNGLSGSRYCCEACGDGVDEDDAQSDDNGNTYCEHCYNERFSYCERYEETCDADSMREVIVLTRRGNRTTQYWSERAVDNEAFECEGNGNYYSDNQRVELADGTVWSQDYFEDNGSVCEGNSECYAHDDMLQLEDGTMWSKDYFSDNGVTVDGKHYAKGDEPQEDAEDADDTADTQAIGAKPYRASPTVKCDAQLEMPLVRGLHIEGPDSDGDWLLKRGDELEMFYATRAMAEAALLSRQELEEPKPLTEATQPILISLSSWDALRGYTAQPHLVRSDVWFAWFRQRNGVWDYVRNGDDLPIMYTSEDNALAQACLAYHSAALETEAA